VKQILVGLLLLVVSGAWVFPQTAPHLTSPGINFFSTQQDIDIGNDSAVEAEKQLSLIRDTRLNQYLRSIAQRVLASSNSSRYQFYIVNSTEVSSLAFPNGSIFVYRGLLAMTSSDAEVAALIAHQVGHVISRHATSQLSRQLLVQAPLSLSGGLPSADGWKEQLNKLGIVFGVDAPFLHYSPEQEVEASRVAAKLLMASRFDPDGFDALLQTLIEASKKPDAPMLTFLYNHPMPASTPKGETEAESGKPPTPGRHTRSSAEFRAFKDALLKLPKPAIEKTQAVDTDLMPNVFSHPLNYYRINYPDGWQVVPTGPNGAIISAPGGLTTTTAGDDVAYGMMLDMFDLSASDKQLTLEQATNRLIVYLRQRNQTVRAVPGAQAPVLINDELGLRTVLLRGGLIRSGKSTVTEPSEVLWLVTRMYYQNLFYMVFVAPEEEFPSRQQIFEQMIRSVQVR